MGAGWTLAPIQMCHVAVGGSGVSEGEEGGREGGREEGGEEGRRKEGRESGREGERERVCVCCYS